MNDPSIESISDIPAANRIGSGRMAYHGAPAAPAPPAMTRSATSLAVSNPRPNSNPTGIHVPRLVHGIGQAAEQTVHQPATVQLPLESGLVVASAPHLPEHLHDAEQDHDVDRSDQVEEAPGHCGADRGGGLAERRVRILHGPVERTHADRDQERKNEHDRRVSERKPETDAQRPLARSHQLARGVVDRGDVIRIERVSQPQRVRGDPNPERQHPRLARVVPAWPAEREQPDEAEPMQADHRRGHRHQGPPLATAQRRPERAALAAYPA